MSAILRTLGLWHWQNLNERRGGETGPAWRHGRAWFGRRYDDGARWALGVEWAVPGKRFGVAFEIDEPGGDHIISGSIHSGFFSLYWHWDTLPPWLRRALRRIPAGEAECILNRDPWAIHASVWARPMEWRSADPWWRKTKVVDLRDFILGRATYSSRVIEERAVVVPMPEGCYEATAKLTEDSWRRRFGWTDRRIGATVEAAAGIPHDGKGENSWDCGEDRTYSLSCSADSIEEGVGKFVASVLRSRKRYGGHREPAVLAPVPPPRAAA